VGAGELSFVRRTRSRDAWNALMRLATCEVLCETCNKAVARKYCQESCICDGCWDSFAQRSASQPLGSSVTALPLCERCEQVPVAYETALCLTCQTGIKPGAFSEKMDFTASLWSNSPQSTSTPSVTSPRTAQGPLQSEDAPVCSAPEQAVSSEALRYAPANDKVLSHEPATNAAQPADAKLTSEESRAVDKGTLPAWFALLCEDVQRRNVWFRRRRKRRNASSVDVCLSATASSSDHELDAQQIARKRSAKNHVEPR
jgi:hypothetical protein